MVRRGKDEALVVVRACFPHAQAVSLMGPFNNWSTVATPMRQASDGTWGVAVEKTCLADRLSFFVWPHKASGGFVCRSAVCECKSRNRPSAGSRSGKHGCGTGRGRNVVQPRKFAPWKQSAAVNRESNSFLDDEKAVREAENMFQNAPTSGAHPPMTKNEPAESSDAKPSKSEDKQLTDLDLIRRVKDGDETALEVLYDRYNRLVYTLALRILANPEEAEDLTIEVFYELWRRTDRYDAARGDVMAYLTLLTRSRSIDQRRRRTRQHRPPRDGGMAEEGVPDVSATTEGPADHIAVVESRKQVLAALEQLEPDHRDPVELSFFEGLSHRQIAQELDLPLGTVKTRIRKALIQLRASFYENDMKWGMEARPLSRAVNVAPHHDGAPWVDGVRERHR